MSETNPNNGADSMRDTVMRVLSGTLAPHADAVRALLAARRAGLDWV